jgi:hypothetical protein
VKLLASSVKDDGSSLLINSQETDASGALEHGAMVRALPLSLTNWQDLILANPEINIVGRFSSTLQSFGLK